MALDLDPATYQPHPLHATERMWMETNCYVDLWIELLHALGLDPLAACAFTLSSDFEGDQWTFFKFPPEDLRSLFGIEVSEMNVWRPVLDHVEEQLGANRLLTVEADAFFLPDTAGVSYGNAHVKTTIVPARVDRAARTLGYFHNAGYFELSGDDYDGIFATPSLPPYVELVRLERMRSGEPDLDAVLALVRTHLDRRPPDNPMVRLRKRLEADLPWLAEQGVDGFHIYAFGMCRQSGANAELAASFVDWLQEHGVDVGDAAAQLRSVSEATKSLLMMLARAARGRAVDLDGPLAQMERDWELAIDALVARHAA